MALAATRRRRTASSCARSPCPSPPSAHRRAAGSCARDSRLTHHPCRPAPRHRIRRREHASLSMSPVRGGGVGVRSRARSARGLGRRWQWQGRASCRQYRPDVGMEWLGSRAGLWWRSRGQGAAGGVACLAGRARRGSPPGRTGSLLGPPAPSARAAAVRRRVRRRSCRRSPRSDAALATASLPRCRGCLRCECGRRAIVGGRPSRAVCWELSWVAGGHGIRRLPFSRP